MLVTGSYGRSMWGRCAAACASLAVVVAGCSSSPSQGAAPPPKPAASAPSTVPHQPPNPPPTPRASATPFVSSADEAGAFAFVKAYFAAVDRAYATGDTSQLVPYRAKTCSCLGAEMDIHSYYDKGGKISGESLIIDRMVLGERGPAFARVGVLFHTPAVRNFLPGKAVTMTQPESGALALDLKRTGNTYVISEVQFKAQAPP